MIPPVRNDRWYFICAQEIAGERRIIFETY
nr:MAG TPA: hypothetical protein [Caudoviricetes sp.]